MGQYGPLKGPIRHQGGNMYVLNLEQEEGAGKVGGGEAGWGKKGWVAG